MRVGRWLCLGLSAEQLCCTRPRTQSTAYTDKQSSQARFLSQRTADRKGCMGQSLSIDWKNQQLSTCSIVRAQHRDAVLSSTSFITESHDTWIIVGLGNPGPRYAATRHNVGFQAVDALAEREGVKLDKLQHNAVVARCNLYGHRVLLAKPMTFMNNSGEAIGKLAHFYKAPPERVLVIYDDLDIPTATVRLRAKGGHGGHNGMRSLAQHLQGNNFPRIRIGVGRPPGSTTVIQHVLQDFTSKERAEIDIAIQEALSVVGTVLELGMEKALSGMRIRA